MSAKEKMGNMRKKQEISEKELSFVFNEEVSELTTEELENSYRNFNIFKLRQFILLGEEKLIPIKREYNSLLVKHWELKSQEDSKEDESISLLIEKNKIKQNIYVIPIKTMKNLLLSKFRGKKTDFDNFMISAANLPILDSLSIGNKERQTLKEDIFGSMIDIKEEIISTMDGFDNLVSENISKKELKRQEELFKRYVNLYQSYLSVFTEKL